MSHLQDNNIGYFRHLLRAWRWAFVLIVHGIFPNIWKTKVSDEICNTRLSSTRKYLLEKHYGIQQ
jgi:hypothetical protein